MQIPDDLRYAENHEWVKVEDGGLLRIGITDFAQDALGDVVYVELPAVGTSYAAGDVFGEVESTKSVSEVYVPVAGSINAINEALMDNPELVNSDPYGAGWFVAITPGDEGSLDALMNAAAYEAYAQ